MARGPDNYSATSSNVVYYVPMPQWHGVEATIEGQEAIDQNASCTWYVYATGGTGDYNYSWTANGQTVGSNQSSVTYGNQSSPFTLGVTVTDDESGYAYAELAVDIQSGAWCSDN